MVMHDASFPGDLLRAERNEPGSKYGELIEGHIRNGTIVPVEITCALLEAAMNKSEKNKFLIDGFPRNEDNLEGWNKAMGDKVEQKMVLFFDCNQETCVKRCLSRYSWLLDGYSQIFRSCVFGPSGFWTMAPLCYDAKFDPFLSLDCARVEGVGAQSKGRRAIVQKPEGPKTYDLKIWL